MEKEWKQFRVAAILFGACLSILGILMMIWPGISAKVTCCLLSVLLMGTGIYELVRYFQLGFVGFFFRFDLTLGICSIIVGLSLLLNLSQAVGFLPYAIGAYMVMSSVFDIQLSVEMRRFDIGNWWLSMLFGIVGTLFAFFLFIDPFTGIHTLMMLMGLSLLISGVQSLYLVYCVSKAISIGKFMEDDNLVDAEWTKIW